MASFLDIDIPCSQDFEEEHHEPLPKRFCHRNGDANLSGDDIDIDTVSWKQWDCDMVASKLIKAGFGDIATIFKEQHIKGCDLPKLTEAHLEKLGINKLGKQLQLLEEIHNLTMDTKDHRKVFNDPIHGHIDLHPLCVKIIDTPQFQRLRFLKQLGTCYFVYPGASHNRFEHSLGVCHLAGQLVRALQGRQPQLNINEKDILCVEIAGLCHDLGHGPFSHLFDGTFIPHMCPDSKWKHEDASKEMFHYLIEDNNLRPKFKEYGLDETDITFILEQITGPSKSPQNEEWCYKGRPRQKSFLYEVVANKRNGIDVDKWDYFARDCHMLGIKNNFDHNRCIKFARVLRVEDQLQICSRDKEVGNLYDMFHTRNTLHRRAYQHKVVKVIDSMINEALVKANNYIKFVGKDGEEVTMTEAIYDMAAFTQMTDNVFFQILYSKEPEMADARTLLQNVLKRKLYKCIAQTQLTGSNVIKKENIQEVKKEIFKKVDGDNAGLTVDDIVVHLVNLDYGMKGENPIDKVRFYSKEKPNVAVRIRKDQVSQMLPEKFAEQHLRLYCKKSDISTKSVELLRKAFQDWCVYMGFPSPKGGDINALELTPARRDDCMTPKQSNSGNPRDTTPDSAGKFKSRLSF